MNIILLIVAKMSVECANISDYQKRQDCITRSESRIEIKEPVQFNPNANTQTQILYKKPSNPSIMGAPLNESFTGITFPPAGWSVYNRDNGSYTWKRDTTNCRTTPACASVRWESSTLKNDDWLITPSLVIQNATLNNPTLSFVYRTSTTTNKNPDDSLVLYISLDDGNTWTKVWQWDGTGTIDPQSVSIPLNQYIPSYPATILLRFAFFDNSQTAQASTNYFNIDSLKISDGQYTFLVESWTSPNAIFSASYDTSNATTTRRWQRRTTACPFTESTTACVGYAYTETGTTIGYAYLISPKIHISQSIIGFYYQSSSTSFIDTFEIYIIKWNNQSNPPTPSDFLNSGVKIDTRYPRTGTTGLPYIYTAYDLITPVSANVNDTIYVAIRYYALNQLRLYIDDVVSVGANTIDLPPSIALLKGATYHFYTGIPDTVRIIVSDPQNAPNTQCTIGYRYIVNSNQEGISPSGPFTEYQMTLTDAQPNTYPDTFIYVINQTNKGLRGNYYIKCTNQTTGFTTYIPNGAPTNNWYIYNVMPTAKFAQKYEFIDEERIRNALYNNNIDSQPDLLLAQDSLVWIDSLGLWDKIYWHQNNTSANKRSKIISYLSQGTCQNRKSLIIFGNDLGYNHDRLASSSVDTIFTRNYLHFRYLSDDWTAFDDDDTLLGFPGKPIFGNMSYQIRTTDIYPDDIRPHPSGDENTSVPILYAKDGDSTLANPANPSLGGILYNGLGYYSIFGSFVLNYVFQGSSQASIDSLIRRIHNFEPISTCLNEVIAYDSQYNLAVDGNSPDILKAILRVNDPSINSQNDLRVYGYYRPYGQGNFTKVLAVYDSSNTNGYFFHIDISVNEPAVYTKDSLEVYFTAHKLNYDVYGPGNISNTSKITYEYDVLNAPTNFQVAYRDLDSAILNWNQPTLLRKKGNSNEILAFQSYILEYSTDNNTWSVLATINDKNITTYTHHFLPPLDSEYVKFYRIKAVYSAGESPYSGTSTIYDIRPPRKVYSDTSNFSIVGNTVNTDVKAVFIDFSPIKYDTIYYRTLLNPWTSKFHDNVISPDTFVYTISLFNLSAQDTLYFYFVVADTFNNVRITDTTKIPFLASILDDIPKKFDITYRDGIVSFALPKSAQVRLEVYNVSGRAVININSNYSAGYVRFDLNKLPRGAYIIRAKTENVNKEFKTVIVK